MKKELGSVEEEVYEEAHMCIHCGLFFKSMPELEIHTEQHLIPTNIAEVCIYYIIFKVFNFMFDQSNILFILCLEIKMFNLW